MRFQGIGTDFYGKKSYSPIDKSYITTKWFVFFLLPIIPLKSYRLIKDFGYEISYIVALSSFQSYKILKEIPLKENVKQILFTYLLVYGGLGLFILSVYLTPIYPLFIFVPVVMVIIFLVRYLMINR